MAKRHTTAGLLGLALLGALLTLPAALAQNSVRSSDISIFRSLVQNSQERVCKDVKGLGTMVSKNLTCKGNSEAEPEKIIPPANTKDINLFFVIDGSDSVTEDEFDLIRIWVIGTIRSLQHKMSDEDKKLFVTILQFSDDYRIEFSQNLSDKTPEEELKEPTQEEIINKLEACLSNMKQMASKSHLFQALDAMTQIAGDYDKFTENIYKSVNNEELEKRLGNSDYVDGKNLGIFSEQCRLDKDGCYTSLVILTDFRKYQDKMTDDLRKNLPATFDRIDSIDVGKVQNDSPVNQIYALNGEIYHITDYYQLNSAHFIEKVVKNIIIDNCQFCTVKLHIVIDSKLCVCVPDCDEDVMKRRFEYAKNFLTSGIDTVKKAETKPGKGKIFEAVVYEYPFDMSQTTHISEVMKRTWNIKRTIKNIKTRRTENTSHLKGGLSQTLSTILDEANEDANTDNQACLGKKKHVVIYMSSDTRIDDTERLGDKIRDLNNVKLIPIEISTQNKEMVQVPKTDWFINTYVNGNDTISLQVDQRKHKIVQKYNFQHALTRASTCPKPPRRIMKAIMSKCNADSGNVTVTIFRGPCGPVGGIGKQGDKGAIGLKGQTGQDGQDGEPGAKGPKGPEGVVGAQGPRGDKGPRGAAGANGREGDKGPTGIQGPKGVDSRAYTMMQILVAIQLRCSCKDESCKPMDRNEYFKKRGMKMGDVKEIAPTKKSTPCICDNGEADTGCNSVDQVKCKSCNDGYKLNAAYDKCEEDPASQDIIDVDADENVPEEDLIDCQCPHGEPHRGSDNGPDCTASVPIKCEPRGCDDTYHFDRTTKKCLENTCSCEHGQAAGHADCTENGKERCQPDSCNRGYHFSDHSHACQLNVCKCDFGTVTSICENHNADSCDPDSCTEGYQYDLVSKDCRPKPSNIQCGNGDLINKNLHIVIGFDHATSLEPIYENFRTCAADMIAKLPDAVVPTLTTISAPNVAHPASISKEHLLTGFEMSKKMRDIEIGNEEHAYLRTLYSFYRAVDKQFDIAQKEIPRLGVNATDNSVATKLLVVFTDGEFQESADKIKQISQDAAETSGYKILGVGPNSKVKAMASEGEQYYVSEDFKGSCGQTLYQRIRTGVCQAFAEQNALNKAEANGGNRSDSGETPETTV